MSNRSSYYQLITCAASLLLIQTLGSTEAVTATATSAPPAAFITTTPCGGGSSSISSRPSSSSWNNVASSSAFLGRKMTLVTPRCPKSTSSSRRSDTSLAMFLGQDSGILGVGAPEVAVIVLVGYFILGPTELYKLTKEIGKTIQNFRSLSTEASKSFESTMENQLELEELRKAQRELNDAFSFRRSINTDESNAFNEVMSEEESAAAAAAAAATSEATAGASGSSEGTKPKKTRRVKRRKIKAKASPAEEVPIPGMGNVPDLDMSDAFQSTSESGVVAASVVDDDSATNGADRLREERKARLASGTQPDSKPDWFDDRGLDELMAPPKEKTQTDGDETPYSDMWSESKAEEADRFAAQLSDQWNESILENEDMLSPLAKIMDRLAILEEEKKAATMRLEEEFRMRGELEEKFYRQKRELLEESAAEIQAKAYAGMASGSQATSSIPSSPEVDNKPQSS